MRSLFSPSYWPARISLPALIQDIGLSGRLQSLMDSTNHLHLISMMSISNEPVSLNLILSESSNVVHFLLNVWEWTSKNWTFCCLDNYRNSVKKVQIWHNMLNWWKATVEIEGQKLDFRTRPELDPQPVEGWVHGQSAQTANTKL